MARGLEGDRGAYNELLSVLTPFMRAYFRKRLGSAAADAEDLVQETLLAVHLKRNTYDRAQPVSPWVYRARSGTPARPRGTRRPA